MSRLKVRLTKADEEAVRILERSRVEISAVVRAAARHRPRSAELTSRLLAEIFELHPEPEHTEPRGYDVRDRRAFADAFREHLRAKRERKRRRGK